MKMIMEDAQLYHKHNNLQRRDALNCLEEYSLKIKWNYEGDRILDIGCGDGGVTTEVLQLFLPYNFKSLVGCDLSEKMIKFAKEHHEDSRVKFTVLDIATQELPADMKESFDHVFSFYTLHWVHQQKEAFSNIFNLLDDGGDCLLLFLSHMPMYDVIRTMSKNPKWSPWLRNVEAFISPYHDLQEPEKVVAKIMEDVGFKQVEVKNTKKIILYDKIEEAKKAALAVNPFNIPEDLKDDFMNSYIDVVRDMQMMDEANNNSPTIKASYTLITAYAKKSRKFYVTKC